MASMRRSVARFATSLLAIVRTERLTLMAGGLAYFTTLAIVPLLVAFASLAGLFLSAQDLDRIVESAISVIPDLDEATLTQLLTLVDQTSRAAFTTSTIVAIGVGVYGASRVVVGLRTSLDAIFAVPVVRSGVLARIVSALIALVLLLLAVLIAISLTVVPTLTTILGFGGTPITAVTWLVAIALIALALWLIYRFGPHGGMPIPWRAPGIWFGTAWIVIVTGLLGTFVSFSASTSAAITALGAPIVVLLWVYLVAFGTLLGASMIAASAVSTETSAEDRLPGR